MAGQIVRGVIYLFLAGALIMLGFALAIEAGVEIMPLPFDYEMVLASTSVQPIKLGLILFAIAAVMFMAQRLWKQP